MLRIKRSMTSCLCCQEPSNIILRFWGKDLKTKHYNAIYVKFTVPARVPGVQGRTSGESLWAGKFRKRLPRINSVSGEDKGRTLWEGDVEGK